MEHTNTIKTMTSRMSVVTAGIHTLLPVIALLTAVLLWGGSFAGMRVVLKSLSPWAVMWCRMITALVIILPFLRKLYPDNYKKGDWKLLVPMVLFQPCLYFFLESNALKLTTSSQAGVISASVPLMVTFGAWIFLSESITKKTIAGLLFSIAGVVALTLFEGPGGTAENPVLGNTLECFAMASAAANMIIIKKLSDRYNPWTLTAMQIIAGTIFFLPGLHHILTSDPSVWTPSVLTILICLGAFASLGAFGLYNWGMSRIPASRASMFINLVPVTAVLIGWTVLGESLSVYQCIAAGIVIFGVMLNR